ncbi:hypothetical protein TraAM80_01229 [Trypanosoma rangeli]|uniref:TFIIH basal transcription factor subunit n=1 Tax=Trypanosoma rangeli TaxID=5698 RepID=A0A422NZX0_TRYRA|nr:uncharacterized protein TraAM80_01229 [Trypanosoma rangeli]RNF10964.1 hypothetical protein TraAM80_01229 [Trypanosoma rangeli]|eukprot:RNF10964.1 hypothetical protein TraAM80_01229 [Trypanosoma rangeli]
MSCCVCILHSSGVLCSPELLTQAAYGVSAMFHSVQVGSADFIPSVALLRANPAEGARYAYTSCVSDAPHDAEEDDDERRGVSRPTNSDAERRLGLAAFFRGRSAFRLRRAILRCGHAAEEKCENGVNDTVDVWRCLAGALLTACGFLRARVVGKATSDTAALDFATAPSTQGYLMVFSDVCDTPALSFAAECSFSAAALALTRLHTTVHVFGRATLSRAVGDRLQALAHSTGGLCAPQFSLSYVGYMLDRTAAETTSQDDNAVDRQVRERLVERYVVQPVNLPQEPNVMLTADGSNASYLAWLCPSCMAVMVRRPWEDEVGKSCPYCPVTNGTDGKG